MKSYRMYLKSIEDGIGISVYAESVENLDDMIFFNVNGRGIIVISADRLEKITQCDTSTDYKEVNVLPELLAVVEQVA